MDRDVLLALLPFVARDDFAAVHVQASGLARHSRGLLENTRVGVLIHAPDAPDADPMQLGLETFGELSRL
jgi:hypothetical protein